MHALASDERFEEAALTRDRLAALSRALDRERLVRATRAAGRVTVEDAHGTVEIDGGRLAGDLCTQPAADPAAPAGKEEIDELLVVARFLFGTPRGTRLVHRADGLLASALPPLPRYAPVGTADAIRPAR